ncbi:ATP synthase mitochondrial F1 complex assembly factor 2-like isoform X2 [Paramacrobiotus metropolitanus]|uniref:ATP synthase mitochondrial F1 complex assembly factor 2-like isoform X2 n=1 Tax=Paramacrobiotus metropolitanus TaxID=2943436 RepID=UPI0024465455|nr:ATP synthase mitochondrial F1 complex assembly factor 2-like isoform X2 [Paramacrobiotus metropolitanus]
MLQGTQNLLTVSKLLSRLYKPAIQRRFTKRDRKRFYQSVSLTQNGGCYEINLDRRKLKTPLGNLLQIPTEPLALAVAAEWSSQTDTIKQDRMYLTKLCNSAVDNPMKRTKEDIAESLLKFLDSDTVCCRVDDPPELQELQNRAWGPVIEFVEKRHGVIIGSSANILGPVVPRETKEILGRYLRSYNTWSLLGFQQAVESLKSLVLTLALVDRIMPVITAVALSRLEEEFQVRYGYRLPGGEMSNGLMTSNCSISKPVSLRQYFSFI